VAKSKPKAEPKQPPAESVEPADDDGKPKTYKTLDEFYAANPEALAKWEDDGVVVGRADAQVWHPGR
jgi:hypothetical protein